MFSDVSGTLLHKALDNKASEHGSCSWECPVMWIDVAGTLLLKALENGVSMYPKLEGRFLQVSGLTFEFDPSAPPLSRVDPALVRVSGMPLDLTRKYSVATKEFLMHGKDGFDMFPHVRVSASDQCFFFSRNIGHVAPEINFLYYLKKIVSGSKHPVNSLFKFENRSTASDQWFCSQSWIVSPGILESYNIASYDFT